MDKAWTIWINHHLSQPWLDSVLHWLSSKWGFGLPLLAGFLVFLIWRYRRPGVKLAIVLAITILVTDAFGGIIKLASPQMRPCSEIYAELRPVEGQSGPCENYHSGMPSNHAANFFALFAFCAWIWRSWRWGALLFATAMAVAVSRVYLGMHYPSQVLAGALLGTAIGSATAMLAVWGSRSVREIHRVSFQRGTGRDA